MRYSSIALKVLAAKECGIIRTNAEFWKKFTDEQAFILETEDNEIFQHQLEILSSQFENTEDAGYKEGFICAYDSNFPCINPKVKKNSEKPFLLFYKGDLTLLDNLNNNVAVIGLINPEEAIVKREEALVTQLVRENLTIVSGLALGCDSVSHKIALKEHGKTIAILPSPLNKIIPSENRQLAIDIAENNGLLVSEYYKDASSRYEAIGRFIERDRLQAMFAKAIILIASYRKDEGDSGSRHAMEAAEKYNIARFVMYNKDKDENNIQFRLNKDLVDDPTSKIVILKQNSISLIKELVNNDLIKKGSMEQLRFQ